MRNILKLIIAWCCLAPFITLASLPSVALDQLHNNASKLLQTADNVTVTSEFEQFGPLQGLREKFETKLHLTNTWSITPYLTVWDAQTNNISNLASHSYLEIITGGTFEHKTNRSTLRFDLGEYLALYSSYNAELSLEYILTSQLTLSAKVDYNSRSTLDVLMTPAGSQDDVIATASYKLTARDKIAATLELDNYRLQDRTNLGGGLSVYGEYNRKLWLGYPDFTLQFNASANHYYSYNSLIQGRVLAILPQNTPPTAASLLTSGYWQTGMNFIYGDDLRDNYSHAWRPYSTLGLEYYSSSGFGPIIDVGITGSVIGRDKLAFYYVFTSANHGQSQINYLVGLSYAIYF